jgi:hypothetical protein
MLFGDQRRAQRRRARIVGLLGHRLVGQQLALHDQPGGSAERLDSKRIAASERCTKETRGVERCTKETRGVERAHRLPRERRPLHLAAMDARAQVESALVALEPPYRTSKNSASTSSPFAVADVDDALAVFEVPVAGLPIGERPRLVEAAEVGPWDSLRATDSAVRATAYEISGCCYQIVALAEERAASTSTRSASAFTGREDPFRRRTLSSALTRR